MAILGGESIEQQFGLMSGDIPDIVVATPGRFLHICIEMNLKLDNISEYNSRICYVQEIFTILIN